MSISGTANLLVQSRRLVEFSDKLHEFDEPRDQADHVSCVMVYPDAKNIIDATRQAYDGAHHNELFTKHLSTVESDEGYCLLGARNCSSSVPTTATGERVISSHGVAVVKYFK